MVKDPKEEIFDVVDEHNNVIGRARRSEVHGNPSLIHRAVHVLVFRPDGKLILQKRGPNKDVDPNLWDTSVGGHVDLGEDFLAAAVRETGEELGIEVKSSDLQYLYDIKYRAPRESENIRTFRLDYGGPVIMNPNEIAQLGEFSPEQIDEKIGSSFFTKNFEQEWHAWKARLENDDKA